MCCAGVDKMEGSLDVIDGNAGEVGGPVGTMLHPLSGIMSSALLVVIVMSMWCTNHTSMQYVICMPAGGDGIICIICNPYICW